MHLIEPHAVLSSQQAEVGGWHDDVDVLAHAADGACMRRIVRRIERLAGGRGSGRQALAAGLPTQAALGAVLHLLHPRPGLTVAVPGQEVWLSIKFKGNGAAVAAAAVRDPLWRRSS